MLVMDKYETSIIQGAARVGLAFETLNKKKTGSQDPALFKCAVGALYEEMKLFLRKHTHRVDQFPALIHF
ncbi:hypothetical protein ACQKI4_12200, partial [Paenibacillus glucanolyticus]|uniref:hypothetical protein n=1 Tax=Paenibacillus glucanolyticus TaxID=59843 RepID=UPI003D049707